MSATRVSARPSGRTRNQPRLRKEGLPIEEVNPDREGRDWIAGRGGRICLRLWFRPSCRNPFIRHPETLRTRNNPDLKAKYPLRILKRMEIRIGIEGDVAMVI